MSDAIGASVAASLTTFATHVGQDISEVREVAAAARFVAEEATLVAARGKVQSDEARLAAVHAQDTATVAAASAAEARRAIEALSARVEALSTRSTGEARTIARIGNMGWESSPSELEATALAVLAAARVDRMCHGPVAAVVNRAGVGSADFKSAADLQAARIAVRALRKECTPGRVALLDTARTRAETQPVRVLHRLADALEAVEEGRTDRQALVRDVPAKAVSMNGRRLAFVAAEKVTWTPHGLRRYAAEDRGDAAAVALSA